MKNDGVAAWKELIKKYEAQDQVTHIELTKEFHRIKLKDFSSTETYINRIVELVNKINGMKSGTISQQAQLTITLSGLDERFHQWVLVNVTRDDLTMEEVAKSIKTIEN
jgi:hypothetical protein